MRTLILATVILTTMSGTLGIYLTNSTNTKLIEKNPAYWTEGDGIWGPILEEWALSNHREKRVMKFASPSYDGYVMVDRSDQLSDDIKESKVTPGKIISSGSTNVVHKKPPSRQVSETDLYLLGAIEKLVYRVDFMEKRLRRVEEMLYFVMAGNRIDHEPCPNNFTRAGSNCYLFSHHAGREVDWKAANKHCRKHNAFLVEMETIEENHDLIVYIQTNNQLKGKDFWTGGLNPGLLWIWSNSARPLLSNNDSDKKNPGANIVGDGRCLKLAYDPALRSYAYRGTDCSIRYSYICELPDTTSSNEVKRIGKKNNIFNDEL